MELVSFLDSAEEQKVKHLSSFIYANNLTLKMFKEMPTQKITISFPVSAKTCSGFPSCSKPIDSKEHLARARKAVFFFNCKYKHNLLQERKFERQPTFEKRNPIKLRNQ